MMDNSSIDTNKILEELNNEKAILMIPAILYVSVLMVAGLIGNVMVCFYYGCKTRQTSNTIFIVALAVFDLITCSVSIPIEIVDLTLFYMFTSSGACKVLRFVNHFAAIASALTLLTISVDRYRRICRPFKKQLNLREAKIACLISAGLSVLFSWPAFVFYDAVSVNITNNFGVSIHGSDCTTIRDDSYKMYNWLFNGFHLILFIISTIALGVLYFFVGRVIFRHNKTRKKFPVGPLSGNSLSSGNGTNETDTSMTAEDHTTMDINNAHIAYVNGEQTATIVRNDTKRHTVNLEQKTETKTNKQINTAALDIKTVKYSIIMLVITVVFVISFLPYLVCIIWRVAVGGYEVDILSDGGLVAFNIALRSYFLNSAINPLTYGFFNSKFRRFFYATFCPWCAKKSGEAIVTSSSAGN